MHRNLSAQCRTVLAYVEQSLAEASELLVDVVMGEIDQCVEGTLERQQSVELGHGRRRGVGDSGG